MAKNNNLKSSEITPENVYLSRRNFLRAGLLAGTTLATAGVYKYFNPSPAPEVNTAQIENVTKPAATQLAADDKPNSFADITNYNNYYEFSTSKTAVAAEAAGFVTRPCSI